MNIKIKGNCVAHYINLINLSDKIMDSINYQTTTSGAKEALELSSRDLG